MEKTAQEKPEGPRLGKIDKCLLWGRDCAGWLLHHDLVQLVLMSHFTDEETEATCQMEAMKFREVKLN